MNWAPVTKMVLRVTRRPRWARGEHSAMYIGMLMEDMPGVGVGG